MRQVVLSGQVHGRVDWISEDGMEIGSFVGPDERRRKRCVLRGPEVHRFVANHAVQKGMIVTAWGEVHARCLNSLDGFGKPQAELVCEVDTLVAESFTGMRSEGAFHINLKGVVMWASEDRRNIKTFINSKEPGRAKQVTCTVNLTQFLTTMSETGREKFKGYLREGREFTTAGIADVGAYISRDGAKVPVVNLFPLDFKLQG